MSERLQILELEPLTREELAYVHKKVERESRRFFKVVRAVMIMCFVIPFVMSWSDAVKEDPNPFHPRIYFSWVLFLMAFASIAVVISYRIYLYRIRRDKKERTKTIEKTHLTRKVHASENGTFYFYIDSPNRLSIEVSQKDYGKMEVGDELNIEYTTHAKDYLGYF